MTAPGVHTETEPRPSQPEPAGRRSSPQRRWANVELILLVIAGGVVGVSILLGDALLLRLFEGEWRGETPLGTEYTDESWTFLDRPEAGLWLFILIAGAALWAVLLVPLVGSLRRWGRPRGLPTGLTALLLTVLIFGLLAAPALTGGTPSELPGHIWKIVVFTILGYLVALVGFASIWSVQAGAAALDSLPKEKRLVTLVELRRSLAATLALLGALLGASILATGALHNALRASGEETAHELVLLYGGFLSLVLALVYAPAHQQLQAVGRGFVDDVAPLPDPASADFSDRLEKRSKLEELLQLNVGVSGGFRAGVAILAPLGTSLVSLLLSQPG